MRHSVGSNWLRYSCSFSAGFSDPFRALDSRNHDIGNHATFGPESLDRKANHYTDVRTKMSRNCEASQITSLASFLLELLAVNFVITMTLLNLRNVRLVPMNCSWVFFLFQSIGGAKWIFETSLN